jgi:hypothetical protein
MTQLKTVQNLRSTDNGTEQRGTHTQLDYELLQCLGLSPDSSALVMDEIIRLRAVQTRLVEQNKVLRQALQRVNRKPYREEWLNEAAFKGALNDFEFATSTLAATKEGI